VLFGRVAAISLNRNRLIGKVAIGIHQFVLPEISDRLLFDGKEGAIFQAESEFESRREKAWSD
jgi:hypothetical protein